MGSAQCLLMQHVSVAIAWWHNLGIWLEVSCMKRRHRSSALSILPLLPISFRYQCTDTSYRAEEPNMYLIGLILIFHSHRDLHFSCELERRSERQTFPRIYQWHDIKGTHKIRAMFLHLRWNQMFQSSPYMKPSLVSLRSISKRYLTFMCTIQIKNLMFSVRLSNWRVIWHGCCLVVALWWLPFQRAVSLSYFAGYFPAY